MIPDFLYRKEPLAEPKGWRPRKLGFIDKTATRLSETMVVILQQETISHKKGFLHSMDTRVKLIIILAYIILAGILQNLVAELALTLLVFSALFLSGFLSWNMIRRLSFITFFFGLVVFLPAALNLFSPGRLWIPILKLNRDYHWWIYSIPSTVGFTREGLTSVTRLVLKVLNSISLAMLLVYSSPVEQVIKALKVLRVPDLFILTFTMSYKFMVIFAQTVLETYQALKMRWWARGSQREADTIIAGRIGYLFRKSRERYEQVFQSMLARGYQGTIRFTQQEKIQSRDYLFVAGCLCIYILILIIDRSYG